MRRGTSWGFSDSGLNRNSNVSHPSDLVERYRRLPFPSGELGDCDENSEKPAILCEIDEHANRPDVSQLLLDILTDSDEYDLARVEATRIVGIYVDDSSPLEERLKRQLWAIFADRDGDALVRQHASQNIAVGFGGESELKVVERVLFDDEDDVDVRHGAFSYLKDAIDTAFVQRLIPRLRRHPYWSKYKTAIAELSRS